MLDTLVTLFDLSSLPVISWCACNAVSALPNDACTPDAKSPNATLPSVISELPTALFVANDPKPDTLLDAIVVDTSTAPVLAFVVKIPPFVVCVLSTLPFKPVYTAFADGYCVSVDVLDTLVTLFDVASAPLILLTAIAASLATSTFLIDPDALLIVTVPSDAVILVTTLPVAVPATTFAPVPVEFNLFCLLFTTSDISSALLSIIAWATAIDGYFVVLVSSNDVVLVSMLSISCLPLISVSGAHVSIAVFKLAGDITLALVPVPALISAAVIPEYVVSQLFPAKFQYVPSYTNAETQPSFHTIESVLVVIAAPLYRIALAPKPLTFSVLLATVDVFGALT